MLELRWSAAWRREGRFLLKYFLTDRPRRRAYWRAVQQALIDARREVFVRAERLIDEFPLVDGDTHRTEADINKSAEKIGRLSRTVVLAGMMTPV